MSQEAKALLEELWDMKLPVDPTFFATELGLSVHEASLGFLSGYYKDRDIYVNEGHPEERKRFTIAHELGHFCLGHGPSRRDTSKSGWYGADDLEKEKLANAFAAELLMPEEVVRYFIDEKGITNATLLRQAFGVSSSALANRLRSLGYIKS